MKEEEKANFKALTIKTEKRDKIRDCKNLYQEINRVLSAANSSQPQFSDKNWQEEYSHWSMRHSLKLNVIITNTAKAAPIDNSVPYYPLMLSVVGIPVLAGIAIHRAINLPKEREEAPGVRQLFKQIDNTVSLKIDETKSKAKATKHEIEQSQTKATTQVAEFSRPNQPTHLVEQPKQVHVEERSLER